MNGLLPSRSNIHLYILHFSQLVFSHVISQDSVVSLVLFHLQPAGGALGFSSDVFIMDAVGGGDMNLGELADLTVANDNDLSMDVITHLFRSIHRMKLKVHTHAQSL